MASGAKTLLFILFLPFLAAIGHDIYINYFSDDEKINELKSLQIDPTEFLISDLGWVWQNWHPESMKTARTMIEPSVWVEKLDPILQMPTMLVGMVPFGLGCMFLVGAFLLGVWPFSRFNRFGKKGNDDYAVYGHAKDNAVRFKRK